MPCLGRADLGPGLIHMEQQVAILTDDFGGAQGSLQEQRGRNPGMKGQGGRVLES